MVLDKIKEIGNSALDKVKNIENELYGAVENSKKNAEEKAIQQGENKAEEAKNASENKADFTKKIKDFTNEQINSIKNIGKVERPNRVEDRDKIGENLDFSSREAYNVLRSSLEFVCLPRGSAYGRVLGVTSPSPREGKSITCINLCYALAKKGNKVLLVDGDLRRPVISKILNLPQKPGLANYLAGPETRKVYGDVLIEGLNVLTAGEIPPNPAELISSEGMAHLLDNLRIKYDYIVLDLPPVNSVSDAFSVSGYLDGILLVVRHGYTRKADVTEACRQLDFASAKILGFVYNGYMEGSKYYYRKGGYYKYYRRYRRYNYYDKYGYYYGYGEESKAQQNQNNEQENK